MPSKHDNRYKIIGHPHRALSRYYMILNRLKTTERKRNSHYKDIKMEITKEEFVAWFIEHDFPGASVDRIDNTKNYSIDNIQMISLANNIRKDKVKAHDGVCKCYRCHKIKPLEEFAKDKRRMNGHATICKVCDNERRKK